MANLTANYIVHYMVSGCLVLMALFLNSFWYQALFYLNAGLHLCLAYIFHSTEEGGVLHYLSLLCPKTRLLVIWLVGLVNLSRWELMLQIVFKWRSPMWEVARGVQVG